MCPNISCYLKYILFAQIDHVCPNKSCSPKYISFAQTYLVRQYKRQNVSCASKFILLAQIYICPSSKGRAVCQWPLIHIAARHYLHCWPREYCPRTHFYSVSECIQQDKGEIKIEYSICKQWNCIFADLV